MSNNLPEKYKSNIFHKIRSFIRNIFMKEARVEIKEVHKEEVNIKSDNVINNLIKEKNKTKVKEEIFSIINKNPNALEGLSTERLYELTKLYDEKILENDREIRYLKSKLRAS